MANVRLDANGIPKGPVYEPVAPVQHRSSVTTVDISDPADASDGVDCAGYEQCRFDIVLNGSGITSLEVQALVWNPRLAQWFGGGRRQFTSTGQHSLVVETRGAIAYLKVVSFSGTSFNLGADAVLS